jgi:hypothetical protein
MTAETTPQETLSSSSPACRGHALGQLPARRPAEPFKRWGTGRYRPAASSLERSAGS